MAKFCTKCGKKLEDGQVCDCEKETKKEIKKETKTESVAVATTSGNTLVNDCIEVFKGIILKPVDTMKKYSKSENFNLGMALIAINAVIFGLFIYLLCKEVVDLVGSVSYLAYFLGFSSSTLSDLDVSFSVLVYGALFMIVYFACLGAMIFVINKYLLKKETDIKEIYSFIGVSSALTSVTTVLVILFVYLKMWVAFVILLFASLMYLMNTYHGFVEVSKTDKNKALYVFSGALAVTLFVVCYVLPKILI